MQMPLFLGLGAVAITLIAMASALWLYAGERVFVDRILSAIAGCF